MLQQSIIFITLFFNSCFSRSQNIKEITKTRFPTATTSIMVGADQYPQYEKYLKGKKVALLVNQTSALSNTKTHLLDFLISKKVNVVKIFSPEHGFRGVADAGEKIANDKDSKTGLPIISLYGKSKKPTKEALENVDVLLFDIQDVGARFYTYISTMHYAMQACADNNKQMIILDRPNPNGYYVAGPILDLKYKSFVGMHPIPIVHGLTVGELALMINRENWLDSTRKCNLVVIPVKNYHHKMRYELPIKPSPNLPNAQSILLYPSLCLFEGTTISVGRGTNKPFQIIGAPDSLLGKFTFTPQSTIGAAKNPMYEGKVCYGIDLSNTQQTFTLKYLIDFYKNSTDKDAFFNNFFSKLIGNSTVAQQIKNGESESAISTSWNADLIAYKIKRKKYLLYKDFE